MNWPEAIALCVQYASVAAGIWAVAYCLAALFKALAASEEED